MTPASMESSSSLEEELCYRNPSPPAPTLREESGPRSNRSPSNPEQQSSSDPNAVSTTSTTEAGAAAEVPGQGIGSTVLNKLWVLDLVFRTVEYGRAHKDPSRDQVVAGGGAEGGVNVVDPRASGAGQSCEGAGSQSGSELNHDGLYRGESDLRIRPNPVHRRIRMRMRPIPVDNLHDKTEESSEVKVQETEASPPLYCQAANKKLKLSRSHEQVGTKLTPEEEGVKNDTDKTEESSEAKVQGSEASPPPCCRGAIKKSEQVGLKEEEGVKNDSTNSEIELEAKCLQEETVLSKESTKEPVEEGYGQNLVGPPVEGHEQSSVGPPVEGHEQNSVADPQVQRRPHPHSGSSDNECGRSSRGSSHGYASSDGFSERSCGSEVEQLEMDSDLEEELCVLWDATVISEVAEFLCLNGCAECLLDVAQETSIVRLKEICLGIVGNLSYFPHICKDVFGKQRFMDQAVVFLESEDARVLVEITRCILACLGHPDTRGNWLEFVGSEANSESFCKLFKFILKSSTNDDLLKNVANLFDNILDGSEKILQDWVSSSLVDAICEGIQQTRFFAPTVTDALLLALQILSTIESGVACLVSHQTRILSITLQHLCTLDHLDLTNLLPTLAAASLLALIRDQCEQELCLDQESKEALGKLLEDLLGLETAGSLSDPQSPMSRLEGLLQSFI